MKRWLLSACVGIGLGWLADGSFLEILAVIESLFAFSTFLLKISKRIAILESINAIAALELLFVPAVTYWLAPMTMPVDSNDYFTYMVPAYTAFYMGVALFNSQDTDKQHYSLVAGASNYLQNKQSAGLLLLGIGLVGFLVKLLFLDAPSFLSTLPYNCLFISVLYFYYAKSRFRWPAILIVLAVLLIYTVREGMFGELFLWAVILVLFLTVSEKRQLTARSKLIFTIAAVLTLLLIQSIKFEYRTKTWGYQRGERNGDASLMGALVADRLANPEKIFSIEQAFIAFVRFNQGIIVGNAMVKVPVSEPYANGEVLLSFLHPLIPRLAWPEKPVTGGSENIRRFTSLPQYSSNSINLSPIGEGYVNFGYGGVIFSFLYGLLLSTSFRIVEKRSHETPSIILWLPAILFGCLTMETDVMSTWGSLVNNAVFIAFLYALSRQLGVLI